MSRAYLVQFGVPLIGAIALDGLLGGVGMRAYQVLGGDLSEVGGLHLPATYWWLVGTLIVGVMLAAALSGLAALERMRPSDLRQE